MTTPHDLLTEAQRILAEHSAITARIEEDLNPEAEMRAIALDEANARLRDALGLRADLTEALEEIREQLDCKPDASAGDIAEVRAEIDEVLGTEESDDDDF